MKNIIFDGNGHSISNFTSIAEGASTVGLFAHVAESTIKNLTIKNFRVIGYCNIGGLIGKARLETNIENCHLENGTISTKEPLGYIGKGMTIGGMIGLADGSITIRGCSLAKSVVLSFLNTSGEIDKNTNGSKHFARAGGLVGVIGYSGLTPYVDVFDCLVATDVKTNFSSNYNGIGGVFGYANTGKGYLHRTIVPWNNVYTSGNEAGAVVGRVNSNYFVRCRDSYFVNTYNYNEANAITGTSGKTIMSLPSSTNCQWVYTNLERRNNNEMNIATGSPGNQQWSYGSIPGVGNGPILSTTNYIIRLTKGSNISGFTGVGTPSDSYYYTPANRDVTATASSISTHQEVKFLFGNEELAIKAQGASASHTFQKAVDGTVSAQKINIPYPINLSWTFDQWTNKLSLNWNTPNSSNISGKWYIYKRKAESSETWTRFEGVDIKTASASNSYSHDFTLGAQDLSTEYEYKVSFIKAGDTAPSTPHPYNSESTIVIPEIKVDITSFSAKGVESGVTITASYPDKLEGNTSYTYALLHKLNDGSFDKVTEGSFAAGLGGTWEYTHSVGGSSCDEHTYKLQIKAFNREFFSTEASAHTTGSTKFVSMEATKGEFNNYVRLEWEVKRNPGGSDDRYKVFRKVSNNAKGKWNELGTVDTNNTSYIYTDNNAMPGVYYRYKVVLYQICNEESTELESLEDIGFSQSSGAVSGRVTYGSGQSVKEVSVSVVRNDLQSNEAQYRSLYSAGDGNFFRWEADPADYQDIVTNDLTYQFWLNPSLANTAQDVKVGYLDNYLTIQLVKNEGNYQIGIKYPDTRMGTNRIITVPYSIKPDRFTHIAFTQKGTNLSIFIVDDEDPTQAKIVSHSISDYSNAIKGNTIPGIRMGLNLIGYIDECRLWTRALCEEEILRDYNRMLVGDEEDLKAYWTFDEGIDPQNGEKGYFFDISRYGTDYNRNHGRHTLASSPVIPTNNQLALKGITDSKGNYQIRGIPFSGEGTSYDIVPSLGTHVFNPSSELRYITTGSLAHDGVNFTDISSFEISGIVTYEGGTYPVTDCNFEIDGKILTHANGTPITNDNEGAFRIEVPIGEHTVRVVKTGHTFVNDGYLTMPEGGYNKNVSDVKFYDKTLVKLIGRVVGGQTESDKPLGFGESINNTGASTITLKTARQQYNLQTTSKDATYKHNEGQWTKPGNRENDETKVQYNPKDIQITISPETGEFVAWVYPEVYNIGKITAPGYVEAIYEENESLDMSSSPVPNDDMLQTSIRTWSDSILVSRKGQIDYYEQVEKSDTVSYHAKWEWTYQAVPTFKVTQVVDGKEVDYFGEIEHTIENSLDGSTDKVLLWENNKYLFDYPVFRQGQRYTFALEAYEEYKNNTKTYPYPINQGTVNFMNNIALTAPEPIELDDTGKANYTFLAGAPDLTTGQHAFSATVQIGSKGYYWDKEENSITAWHLGDKTTGTDFKTHGPNEISVILRDPPGSLSYSYIEQGTTITTNTTNEITNGLRQALDLTTFVGGSITSFVGMGGGVITEVELTLDVSAGLKAEQIWKSTEEKTQTLTFTERVQTSDNPLYVGHYGDVFVGNSTNIQYGLTNGISIQKNYLGNDPSFSTKGNYSIAKSSSIAYGQTFDTRFIYTQVEIEEIMIPKWQESLALLLYPKGTKPGAGITEPVYVSNLDRDDENFGKLNTDKEAFGTNVASPDKFHDGPSYTIYFPADYDMSKFVVDSVMWFNNQINGWIEVLAQNEKEKVEMAKLGNYSIGSGGLLEWSRTETTSKTTSSSFNWVLNPTIGLATGGSVAGIGLELSTSMEYIHEEGNTETTGKETSIISGFVLQEDGDDDQISIDYGMTKSGTIAFKTRGGRTSCPHEQTLMSKYYQPQQHVLSEGTMQIEVPVIDIKTGTPSQMLNVPANKTASFSLELKNESETGEDVYFEVIVDESTNQKGAQ
ncbi:hypothetical protein LJB91_03565, partial [Bacteroidales bacterium OttesenSCG-928-L03]|nr:hypothetical protein [Bacteroidales bacterium OttesenSCG-928-L03]